MNNLAELFASIDVCEWLDYEGIGWKKINNTQIKLDECVFCGGEKAYLRSDDGRGTCHSGKCGQRWNLFGLVREFTHLDNRQTIKRLEAYADGAGIRAHRAKAPLVVATNSEWDMPPHDALPTTEGHTHPDLIKRKITVETQALFGLSYCTEGWFKYTNHEGRATGMPFSNRILIPVHDLDGSLQTFQGRACWDVDEELGERRYLFPPTLPGSGHFIYGANLCRGKPHLVMGEGPFDTMAIHQAMESHPDFKDYGAVGSFGLSIGSGDADGDDQLGRFRTLHREGLKSVTIMWDGERAALMRALDNGLLLRRQGIAVKIAMLPQDKDPNEVSTNVVRQAIYDAMKLTDANFMKLRLNPPYE